MTAVDGGRIFYTVNQHLSHGGVYPLYFTGTPKFTVKLENSTIHHINGRADYGGLKKEPDSDYYTFTPPEEEDIVLNDTIIHEPFTMTNGYPTASNGGKTASATRNTVISCSCRMRRSISAKSPTVLP